MEERLDVGGAELVTDGLQPGRVGAGGEPVGQLGEPDPGDRGLLLGPLVTVQPHLGRIWEIGADLDERWPEVEVPQVEVETGDPPVGLAEGEHDRRPVDVAFGGGEHVLVLLGHPDRRHTRQTGRSLPVQIRPHHVLLAVVLLELHHRNVMRRGEAGDRAPEPGPDLLHDRRRRDRIPQMTGHEPGHLPAALQLRHVPVEVQPVQTLHIQRDMPVQQPCHREHLSHPNSLTPTGQHHQTTDSAVRGEASLVPRKESLLRFATPSMHLAAFSSVALRPGIPSLVGVAMHAPERRQTSKDFPSTALAPRSRMVCLCFTSRFRNGNDHVLSNDVVVEAGQPPEPPSRRLSGLPHVSGPVQPGRAGVGQVTSLSR